MPKVTYTSTDGVQRTLDVECGTSVMQAAISQGVDGIIAECGGQAMCATCHVYVDADFVDLLPDPSDDEHEMLEGTSCERTDASRLSCQVRVTDALDGLVVRLPESQV